MKKQTILRKSFSLVLAILMVVALVPAIATGVSAADAPEATIVETGATGTLSAMVTEAAEGQTVKLLKDVDLGATISIGKTLTIDGDGYTIYRKEGTGKTMKEMFVLNGSAKTLTFKSVTLDGRNIAASSNDSAGALHISKPDATMELIDTVVTNMNYDKGSAIGFVGQVAVDANGYGHCGNLILRGNTKIVNNYTSGSGSGALHGRTGLITGANSDGYAYVYLYDNAVIADNLDSSRAEYSTRNNTMYYVVDSGFTGELSISNGDSASKILYSDTDRTSTWSNEFFAAPISNTEGTVIETDFSGPIFNKGTSHYFKDKYGNWVCYQRSAIMSTDGGQTWVSKDADFSCTWIEALSEAALDPEAAAANNVIRLLGKVSINNGQILGSGAVRYGYVTIDGGGVHGFVNSSEETNSILRISYSVPDTNTTGGLLIFKDLYVNAPNVYCTAGWGGGILINGGYDVVFDGVKFMNLRNARPSNWTKTDCNGAVLYTKNNVSGGSLVFPTITLRDCEINNCEANKSGDLIYLDKGTTLNLEGGLKVIGCGTHTYNSDGTDNIVNETAGIYCTSADAVITVADNFTGSIGFVGNNLTGKETVFATAIGAGKNFTGTFINYKTSGVSAVVDAASGAIYWDVPKDDVTFVLEGGTTAYEPGKYAAGDALPVLSASGGLGFGGWTYEGAEGAITSTHISGVTKYTAVYLDYLGSVNIPGTGNVTIENEADLVAKWSQIVAVEGSVITISRDMTLSETLTVAAGEYGASFVAADNGISIIRGSTKSFVTVNDGVVSFKGFTFDGQGGVGKFEGNIVGEAMFKVGGQSASYKGVTAGVVLEDCEIRNFNAKANTAVIARPQTYNGTLEGGEERGEGFVKLINVDINNNATNNTEVQKNEAWSYANENEAYILRPTGYSKIYLSGKVRITDNIQNKVDRNGKIVDTVANNGIRVAGAEGATSTSHAYVIGNLGSLSYVEFSTSTGDNNVIFNSGVTGAEYCYITNAGKYGAMSGDAFVWKLMPTFEHYPEYTGIYNPGDPLPVPTDMVGQYNFSGWLYDGEHTTTVAIDGVTNYTYKIDEACKDTSLKVWITDDATGRTFGTYVSGDFGSQIWNKFMNDPDIDEATITYAADYRNGWGGGKTVNAGKKLTITGLDEKSGIQVNGGVGALTLITVKGELVVKGIQLLAGTVADARYTAFNVNDGGKLTVDGCHIQMSGDKKYDVIVTTIGGNVTFKNMVIDGGNRVFTTYPFYINNMKTATSKGTRLSLINTEVTGFVLNFADATLVRPGSFSATDNTIIYLGSENGGETSIHDNYLVGKTTSTDTDLALFRMQGYCETQVAGKVIVKDNFVTKTDSFDSGDYDEDGLPDSLKYVDTPANIRANGADGGQYTSYVRVVGDLLEGSAIHLYGDCGGNNLKDVNNFIGSEVYFLRDPLGSATTGFFVPGYGWALKTDLTDPSPLGSSINVTEDKVIVKLSLTLDERLFSRAAYGVKAEYIGESFTPIEFLEGDAAGAVIAIAIPTPLIPEDVTVQIVDKLDNSLVWGEFTYNVKNDYIDTAISAGSASDLGLEMDPEDFAAMQDLLKDMLRYSSASRYYYDYSGAIYGYDDTSIITGLTDVPAVSKTAGNPIGAVIKSHAITLDAEVTIRHYVTFDNEEEFAEYSFYVDGKHVPLHVDLNGRYYVLIDHIGLQNIGHQYVVKITRDGGEYTYTYGVINYIENKLANGSSDIKKVVSALYNYYKSAMIYFELPVVGSDTKPLAMFVTVDKPNNYSKPYGVNV